MQENQDTRQAPSSNPPLNKATGSQADQFAGAGGVTADVGELLEEVLQASQEPYRTIVQMANEGIWLIDSEARTLYANDRMADLLGVSAAELPGHTVLEFIYPEDLPDGQARIQSNLQGQTEQFEFRFRRADGSELHVLASTSPVRDRPGQVVGALGMFTDVTVRKRMEQDLMRSEALLHLALRNSPISVYQQDRDLRYTWINNPSPTFTPETIIGKTDDDFVLPEEASRLTAIKQRVLETGESAREEIQTTSAAGARYQVLTVEPLRDKTGSIVGVTGTSIDITEQRQLEQRARRVLEALLEMAQVMVQGATPEQQEEQSPAGGLRALMQRMASLTRAVVGCNRLGFTGVEPGTERLYPLAVAGLPPDQERQWWREQEQLDVHLSEGVDLSLVKRLRANEILLMDLTQPPYRDQPNPYGIRQMLVAPIVFASRLLGLLTMDYGGLDHFYTNEELSLVAAVSQLVALAIEQNHISREREEALARERALSAAYQRTIQLIELAHDAVIVRDLQSRIQFWNQGAERLYGWTQNQALGQATHTLLSTRFPTSFDEVQQVILATDQWEGVLEHVRSDGGRVMVESRQVLVRNADGSPEAILEINRDITDRERLTQEREEARASELAAREAARRMDEFMSMISHELKTPLTSISGNLQLARRRLTSILNEAPAGDSNLLRRLEEVQAMLTRAERQVGVQNRLVSDLVDASRISVERLALRLEPVELIAIIRDVVEDQRAAMPSRSIAFDTTTLAVTVQADGERIGQVVNNYVSNALKYSAPDRPVMIRVDVQADYVRVSVRDEGPGLSPEQQERIWERFYRAPDISVQVGSGVGLGLGLHICQKIIEQHGGQVGVESARGQGATFWFNLPLDRAEQV